MEKKTKKFKAKPSRQRITVRDLHRMLIEYNPNWEVYVRDEKTGKRLSNVSIMIKEPAGIGCLFG